MIGRGQEEEKLKKEIKTMAEKGQAASASSLAHFCHSEEFQNVFDVDFDLKILRTRTHHKAFVSEQKA